MKVTGLPAPLRASVTCPRGDIFYGTAQTANHIRSADSQITLKRLFNCRCSLLQGNFIPDKLLPSFGLCALARRLLITGLFTFVFSHYSLGYIGFSSDWAIKLKK
jgi:hypothetical protein